MREFQNKPIIIDSIISLALLGYIFIKWLYFIWIFGTWLYSLSLSFIIFLIMFSIVIDYILLKKRKGFLIQIIINCIFLLVYSIFFIIICISLFGFISLSFFLLLGLILLKIWRIFFVIKDFRFCKSNRINTKLKIDYFKRNNIFSIIFIISFCFPSIIFGLGFSNLSLAYVDIDINNNPKNIGSQKIKISFYATSTSYDYLTDGKVLGLLNGTDFNDGEIEPAEILLLVRESELLNMNQSKKLAFIINNCTKNGLKVWIWFVYLPENGYYPSYEDYKHLKEFKDLFNEWISNFSLDIYGLLFDNEWDQVISEMSLDNPINYLTSIIKHRQEAKGNWNEVCKEYKKNIKEWSDEGYKIALVGMEPTPIDIIDGDPDIQQLFGIVNDPPDVWERVSFMFYRSCEYHYIPYSQDYLYNLAKLHKELYKERAVVAIGCMSYKGYDTINGILKDIALLKYLNYSTIELFEFGAFYNKFGSDGLIKVLNASQADWKFPKFRLIFYSLEFFTKCLIFLADVILDFI
ncbi:MAG: hypothetical protein ACP6IY_02225 [Promethearchaeia archaeon]